MMDYDALQIRFFQAMYDAKVWDGEHPVTKEKIERAWDVFQPSIEIARKNDLETQHKATRKLRIPVSVVALILSIISLLLSSNHF